MELDVDFWVFLYFIQEKYDFLFFEFGGKVGQVGREGCVCVCDIGLIFCDMGSKIF